jgi:hypothetical protein
MIVLHFFASLGFLAPFFGSAGAVSFLAALSRNTFSFRFNMLDFFARTTDSVFEFVRQTTLALVR